MKRAFPTLAVITVVLLSACIASPPAESDLPRPALVTAVAPQATTTPVPAAAVRPTTTALTPSITAESTVATVAGPSSTPALGLPAPIWWTVHSEIAADGRTVYRVDQPEVKEMVGEQYHEILTFYSNQDGPADLSRAAYYSVDDEVPLREASRATAVAQGWYWRIPVPETLHWEGEPEFSADGSEVTWTFVITDEQIAAENLYSRQVALGTGEVMQEVRLPPLRQTVFLRYDPQQGRWRLDDAKSHMQLLPTPTPAS